MPSNLLVGAAAAVAVGFVAHQRNINHARTRARHDVPFSSYSVHPRTLTLLSPVDEGYPSAELGVHFDVVTSKNALTVTQESLMPNEVLVKVLCLSADPYQRGRIKSTNSLTGVARKSGPAPMVGFVSGKVLASRHPKWSAGDFFGASLPLTTVQVVDFNKALVWPLQTLTEENISLGVGVLGMPGSTAYGGLLGTLRPQRGETLYVSGAAGAVGSLVGELGKKLFDLKVIGSCGGPAKTARIVDRHSFDVAIDRKTLPKWGVDGNWTASKEELKRRLKEAAPEGIDMYFDNVGADHFEAAFESLRSGGRAAICGQIATYNAATGGPGKVSMYPGQMIYTQQRVEGIICSDWLTGKRGNFHQEMPQWLEEGKITVQETAYAGLEEWPKAFASLFTNTHTKDGKVVVNLGPEDFPDEHIVN